MISCDFVYCLVDRCLSLCTFFLLAIVLFVLLRYTDSDYPFGIFKLFLRKVELRGKKNNNFNFSSNTNPTKF
jgi:hypothetical protein